MLTRGWTTLSRQLTPWGIPRRPLTTKGQSVNLSERHCKPCEGGVTAFNNEQSRANVGLLHSDWKLIENGKKLQRNFSLDSFVTAVGLVDKIKIIAEGEGHHPDLHLTGYKNLTVEYYTHAIGGLSENDFICAAKVDKLDTNKEKPKKLELYSYYASSCSYRVRLALSLKGIPYDYIPINIKNTENYSPSYTQLNPSQLVPTLVVDGFPLSQSLPIIEYLEEKYPLPSLFPLNTVAKYQAKSLVMIICDIQPQQNISFLRRLFPEKSAHLEQAKIVVEQGFDKFERAVSKTAGKYCVGNVVTIADCFLVPQVHNALNYGINVPKYPHINKIYNSMLELDAVKAAAPSAQPDAPKEK